MNELTIDLVLGLVTPFIASFLKNPRWSDTVKVGLVVLVSVLLALAVEFSSGRLSWTIESILPSAATIFATATILYKTLLANTSINKDLENALHSKAE